MNSFVTKFACTPFLNPPPPDPRIQTTSLQPRDALFTLFEGFDRPLINDISEKNRMFVNLNTNLPTICNLQSEKMPSGAESNKYCGSIPLFLHYLCDTSTHLFSLCPIPKFDTLDLDNLIRECLNLRITPQRAVWGIHHYVKRTNVTHEMLTNVLKYVEIRDQLSYIKLCAAIYRSNLLDHISFLEWAVKKLEPEILTEFTDDFVRTHSLLYSALLSNNSSKFINLFQNALLVNQSHLIQFAVICEFNKLDFEQQIFNLISSENMKNRVRYMYELLLPSEIMCPCTIPLSILIPKVIFRNYPKAYDFDKILYELKRAIHFAKPSKFHKISMDICNTLINFHDDTINLATLIAWLIRGLNFKVKISEFVEWIYDNFDQISSIKFLFYELQYQKLITYKEFHDYIHKCGYLKSRNIQTYQIVSEFPTLDRSKECLASVLCDLRRIYPGNDFDSKLNFIGSNVINQTKIVEMLPYIIKFVIALKLVSDSSNLKANLNDSVQFLEKIDASILIPELSKNRPDFIPSSFEKLRNVYKAHGLLDIIDKTELANLQDRVNTEQAIKLFNKNSFLCSLHVFDTVFQIRTTNELATLLNVFFEDLVSFPIFSYELLSTFFFEFINARVVAESVPLFAQTFFSVVVKHPSFDQNIISCFLNDIFNRQLLKPSQYFIVIFNILNKYSKSNNKNKLVNDFSNSNDINNNNNVNETSNDCNDNGIYKMIFILIKSVFSILDDSHFLFEVADCLTVEVVDCFNTAMSSDTIFSYQLSSLYQELLSKLRKLKPPQLHSVPPASFARALFSILPEELLSDDVESAVRFFKANVSRQTLYLWSLWLRDRPKYLVSHEKENCNENESEHVVVSPVNDVSDSDRNSYCLRLIDSLSDSANIFNNSNSISTTKVPIENETDTVSSNINEKTNINTKTDTDTNETNISNNEINVNKDEVNADSDINSNIDFGVDVGSESLMKESWWIFCENKSISNAVISKCLSDASIPKVDYLHPALLSADESIYERFCEKLRNHSPLTNEFIDVACATFIIFTFKFASNQSITVNIADRLLEWIPRLEEEMSPNLMKTIDTFNFLICWTLDLIPGASSSDLEHDARKISFQDNLHTKIMTNLKKLPSEIKAKIILNRPMQMFEEVPDPLFSDFVAQDSDTGSQFPLHSNYNEGNDGGGYHTDFGWMTNFDDVDQLFWT